MMNRKKTHSSFIIHYSSLKTMALNLKDPDYKRIVIVGGGFAGLTLAQKLINTKYQVVLVDKNNYFQFQPLFYQVAMGGLEPSSIVFPFRKVFQKADNVLFRVAELKEIFSEEKYIQTDIGQLTYDYLVIAVGADTNFFGNKNIEENAIPMKSVSEALFLRNAILDDYEKALLTNEVSEQEYLFDVVVVGGGATGVEVSGALAEMRNNVLPKEYKELNYRSMDIYLVQSGTRLLNTMSENASAAAQRYLEEMGVKILFGNAVTDYDGKNVIFKNGDKIAAHKLIWAAGIICNDAKGLPPESFVRGKRVKTNAFHAVEGVKNIFAIGDIAFMQEGKFVETGHPQVAQTAIQMAKNLANNFKNELNGKAPTAFHYKDLGSLATIGRNKAVADLPFWHFQGVFAWFVWMFVHLTSLMGVKNKVFVFLNWVWGYISYDQGLRLIIRPKIKNKV